MDGVQMPPGTTECNHSYYTRNSFSASDPVLQLQNHGTGNSVQPLTHTQQANGTASSGSVSSPQLPCSTISSQVPVCPIRNDTGDVMPLAQAITQLSFLEFLQHCGVPLAPPQPSQLPVPISLLDAVQTNPPGDVFQDVSTQTSDQQDTLSCDVAVQTSSHGTHILSLDAAAQTTSPSTLSQHVSTQMGSRLASSFSVDVFVQTLVRSVVLHDVAIQLPITEFFIGCVFSNDPLDRLNLVRQSPPPMQGSHPLLHPPPGLEQPAPPHELAAYSHLLTTHGAPANSFPSHAQQSPVSTTLVGTHPVRTAGSAKRSASTALREPTTLLVLILVQEQVPSLNHGHWYFPWSILGNPSPTDLVTLTQLTAISCTINSAFPFFSGIQARRAEILPTLSPLPVVSFMRLFFKKPAIMFRTSLISLWHSLTTRTSLSCSTRIPLSLTL